jgi:hypothetical protein
MIDNSMTMASGGERGVALVMALLTMALLLALTMGISLTAISELGVSNTYGTQTVALQAAEAGLNHAGSLVANYTGADFTALLALRPTPLSTNYLTGNNPFTTANVGSFAAGVTLIDDEDANLGYQLRSAIVDPATGSPAVVPGAYYRVSLLDDEPTTSTASPKVPNFTPGTYRENDNNAAVDKNNRLVIYSTGTYNNASVTLEGWIAFLPYPALCANGDITVGGNSVVNGLYGGVHSNSNLLISTGGGNNWQVEQTFTASGQINGDPTGHVGGFFGGGQEPLEIPPFVTTDPLTEGGANTNPRIQDYVIRKANRLLIDSNFADGAHGSNANDTGGGTAGNAATRRLASLAERLDIPYTTLVAAVDSDTDRGNKVNQTGPAAVLVRRNTSTGVLEEVSKMGVSDTGWSYSGSTNATWGIDTNANGLKASGCTFYVVGVDNYNSSNPGGSPMNGGNVSLTGNVGSAGAALQISILATGSIQVAGTPNITANLLSLSTPLLPPFASPNILMIAIQDIKITGDNNSAINFTGVSFAGEQVELSSSGDVNGQILSLSNTDCHGSPSTPVTINSISGRFNLTLNDGNSVGRVKLFSWRQIKR